MSPAIWLRYCSRNLTWVTSELTFVFTNMDKGLVFHLHHLIHILVHTAASSFLCQTQPATSPVVIPTCECHSLVRVTPDKLHKTHFWLWFLYVLWPDLVCSAPRPIWFSCTLVLMHTHGNSAQSTPGLAQLYTNRCCPLDQPVQLYP